MSKDQDKIIKEMTYKMVHLSQDFRYLEDTFINIPLENKINKVIASAKQLIVLAEKLKETSIIKEF